MAIRYIILLLLSTVACADIGFVDVSGGNQDPVVSYCIDELEGLSFRVVTIPVDTTVSIYNMPAGSEFEHRVFSWTPDIYQSGDTTVYFVTDSEVKPLNISVTDTCFTAVINDLMYYVVGASCSEIMVDSVPDGMTVIETDNHILLEWLPTVTGLYYVDCHTYGDARTLEIKVTRLNKDLQRYDFNDDDQINIIDFAMFANHWLE